MPGKSNKYVLVIALGIIFIPGIVLSEQARIAVVFPYSQSPYNTVFNTIVTGIEASGLRVKKIKLEDGRLSTLIHPQSHFDGYIAIGDSAFQAIRDQTAKPIVVGARTQIPEGYSGVSLSSNPKKFFEIVQRTLPETSRIHVVYSDKNSGAMILEAQRDIKTTGMELEIYKSNSLRESLKIYRSILWRMNSKKEALWLTLDPISVESRTILPMLLKEAWSKELRVISNKPAHARSGILLATFPDNFSHGLQLAKMMGKALKNQDAVQVEASEELRVAMNSRTAGHLRIDIPAQDIDLVYPARSMVKNAE